MMRSYNHERMKSNDLDGRAKPETCTELGEYNVSGEHGHAKLLQEGYGRPTP